jgi:hypothetical protein
MKHRDLALLAVAAFCAAPLMADVATLVYETPAAGEADFALDTLEPHTHATGAEIIPYAAGATVTETAPDGTETVRVSSAPADGTLNWNPSQGGIWTLTNSLEGETTFTVRHPAATHGDGTAADPAKIMDADELVDLGAGAGYVFRLCGADWLVDALRLPAGCGATLLGDGLWRLDSAADGCVCTAIDADFLLDTELPGPDRTARRRNPLPFAYSGDDWAGSATASSTLTFTPPAGVDAPAPVACVGLGAYVAPFSFAPGTWTVALSGSAVTTLSAELNVLADFTMLYMR